MKVQTSEYCAVGHPDRLCDYIVATILDKYLEKDPKARVALECQLKDAFATLSGEVTSMHTFTDDELKGFVREAIAKVGYTREYQAKFGKEHTIAADDVEVTLHVSRQSADIAQGVDREGWGDQGIFFGYAVRSPDTNHMPKDYFIARGIADTLRRYKVGGLDIKTQVTMIDGLIREVVVAIPLIDDADKNKVAELVRSALGQSVNVTVNGTGRYVTHGPIGDCGTTGRKLVVDFYGGNAKIGGGSPWGKDPTKADVTLNMLARKKALDYLKMHNLDEVTAAISAAIGRAEIRVSFFNGANELLETWVEKDPPSHIIDALGLDKPGYAERCESGLFGRSLEL